MKRNVYNGALNLAPLSKYRQELMGISAVLILICHSTAFIKFQGHVSTLLSFGNIGVDIFLFLSGMGLYYSLSKTNFGREWYVNRYLRLLVPYLLIELTLDAFTAYCKDESFTHFMFRVSTLSFWTDHNTYWFVALLIPLYLITPILFSFLRENSKFKIIVLTVICFIVALFPMSVIGLYDSPILENIQFVMPRIPCYLVGLYMGRMVKNGDKVKYSTLVCLVALAVTALLLTRHLVYIYVFLILPIMLMMTAVFCKIEGSLLHRIALFYGKVSLESYILNVATRFYISWLLMQLAISDANNIIFYTLVIIIGSLLTIPYNMFANKIIDYLKHNVVIK